MLAVDKAEDLLSDYFKKFGLYFMTGDETHKLALNLVLKEMQNVSNLYESHRLYVFLSSMRVFHKLFVEKGETELDTESIQDTFARVEKIFNTYSQDQLYYHLNLVFEFLKLEYFTHFRIYKEAEKYFEEINDATSNLLVNYPYYTFSSRFLILKLERALRTNTESELYGENEALFQEYEADANDVPRLIIYSTYRSLSCYYAGKFDESARILNNLINEVSLKPYPLVQMEVKALLALQYCLLKDFELFNQLSNSVQRQIRLIGKDACENVLLFLKMLKIAISEAKREKPAKINALIPRFKAITVGYFAPTSLVRMDERFVDNLTALEA